MLKPREIRRSVVFVQKVYIHGGSFMLGGYIGAGPRKLLERDMVLSLQFSETFLKSNLVVGACIPAIQSGSSWFPLPA